MVEQEIKMSDGGIWTILEKDNMVCIVDSAGRARYFGNSYMNVAMHLAMHLAERKLEYDPSLDEALRMQVERFRNE